MKPSLYSTVTKFLWRKWCFLKKEIVFKKKRNLYKNFTVWLQDGDILRKSMMYILLSWSSRWRRKKIVIELNFTTIYYITELAACYFGRIEKNRQFWTKIETNFFLLLQRALISYFSFSSSILSNFLANVIKYKKQQQVPITTIQVPFWKENKKWNNDWWKRKQTVPCVVNNTMMMIKKQLKSSYY